MALSVAQKLIQSHLKEGEMHPGESIALAIDQTSTQDATGTLVMLILEALDLERAQTEVSVQYVDHNRIQEDLRNAGGTINLRREAAKKRVSSAVAAARLVRWDHGNPRGHRSS